MNFIIYNFFFYFHIILTDYGLYSVFSQGRTGNKNNIKYMYILLLMHWYD